MSVLISAGHGAGDPGAVAYGYKEADIVLELRDIIASKLRAAGVTVKTDGNKAENLGLRDAIKLIAGTDVAVELHCNAAANKEARGVETISLPSKKLLSQRLSKAIAGVTGDKLRGEAGWIDQSKSARGKLGFVQAGGVIVELFFLSNKESLDKYQGVKWLVGSAIAAEVAAYVKE